MKRRQSLRFPVLTLLIAAPASAQEPAAWGREPVFHTFSIVAIDPSTGESGVAVTTRNPCVGNAVPWVRAGVGAVATQGGTRMEYGMLHALGFYRPDSPAPSVDSPDGLVYDPETVEAVDRFRRDQGWRTTVPGYVDRRTIDRLWELLDEINRAAEVRDRIRDIVRVRR